MEYVPFDELISELREWVASGGRSDYITCSGSGEPTLHIRFGDIISEIKRLTNIPVCLLTNGTLFSRPDVRAQAALADLVIPSLDAPNEDIFVRINRPADGCNFQEYLDGLRAFAGEYSGDLWLEIFLVPGINDDDETVNRLAEMAEEMKPDKIQLNTAVRPPAEGCVKAVPAERMSELAGRFTPPAEVIASYHCARVFADLGTRDKVLQLLNRRPCTLEDIAAGLAIKPADARQHVLRLLDTGLVMSEQRGSRLFYLKAR